MPLSDYSSLGAKDLLTVFPDEDYEFRLNPRRDEPPASFLGRSTDGAALLAERNTILSSHPERHRNILPDGEYLLEEFLTYLKPLNILDPEILEMIREQRTSLDRCTMLARHIEPDFALLHTDTEGENRLMGGCVCFPSSWSPEKKMGLPLFDIHGVVPGLDAELGEKIRATLSHMEPGKYLMRSDWGLKALPDLNHHPLRGLPAPDQSITLEESFLRVERQMFFGLPKPKGVTSAFGFSIRVSMFRISEFIQRLPLKIGLERAIRTMPEEVAQYKAIASARERLLELLSDATER